MSKTLNTDTFGYVSRIDRFLLESLNQASANTSNLKTADFNRLKSYLSALRSYLDHVSEEPELDLPESNPKEYTLPEMPSLKAVENDDLADCCRLLELCRFEIANSQSSRQSSGLIAYDKVRQVSIIEKAERFLKNYVAVVQPVDLPESSPRNITTGSGFLGIEPDNK